MEKPNPKQLQPALDAAFYELKRQFGIDVPQIATRQIAKTLAPQWSSIRPPRTA